MTRRAHATGQYAPSFGQPRSILGRAAEPATNSDSSAAAVISSLGVASMRAATLRLMVPSAHPPTIERASHDLDRAVELARAAVTSLLPEVLRDAAGENNELSRAIADLAAALEGCGELIRQRILPDGAIPVSLGGDLASTRAAVASGYSHADAYGPSGSRAPLPSRIQSMEARA
ncbi:MAG: hypothetical protein ACI91O_000928 [Candidatus Poriferisodalaceae bacterium]|jgi:hypothetical protein